MNIKEINFDLSALALPVVTLIGPPGSGKTEVGKQLAEDLGWTFWDTDVLIEQTLGLTIPEIFTQYGQHTFRFSEKKLVETIGRIYSSTLELRDKTNPNEIVAVQGTIISTGGGLPVLGDNLAILSRIGTVITLYASIEVLVERTARKSNRPLLNPTGSRDPDYDRQQLKTLVDGRKHVYERASLSIDTSDLTIATVAESIKKALGLS